MNSELTNSILQALLTASEEHKETALKVLRGEPIQTAEDPAIGPLLLGMGVAAEFLGVSRPTLWRVLQSGKITKIELFPGSYRVRRTDIEALAAGKLGMTPYKSRRGRPRKNVQKGGAS
ncbi:MAG: helix-turn-helix domain-containing protein [Kiritimatiellae bacterium]|nr:helix-turn-helix domain-containing protein [Kiritimatiellia bacterium]